MSDRALVAICQPIRAAGRTRLDIVRHASSLYSVGEAVRRASRFADFIFVTVLSGPDDGSGASMALAVRQLADRLHAPHLMLSCDGIGKPPAVNAALREVWHRTTLALVLDDDVVIPAPGIATILEMFRTRPTSEYICFLKTALGPAYYEKSAWTPHLEATYRSFLPSVVSAIVRLHPEYYSLVPTGSAYAAVCRGPLLQLPSHCNEADVIVASDYMLTGLSVGSWFGSHRDLEVERRRQQITNSLPNSSRIRPAKATRFLRVPRNLESSLSTVFGTATAQEIATSIRHTSSIMEDTYDQRTEIAEIS